MWNADGLSRAVAWGGIAALLVVLLWSSWTGPDVFYHLALGRSVVETSTFQPPSQLLIPQPAYCNVYWLFQVVLWGIWSVAGVVGVSLFFMLLWFGVLALCLRTARLHLHPILGALLALAVVLVVHQRFEPRPEVVSYLFLSAQVGWLSRWRPQRDDPTRLFVLFALTEVVWVNVHGYFILGPALVGTRLVSAMLVREDRRGVRRTGVLLGITTLATLASPFGLGAWRFVATLAVFLREMRAEVAEFGPPVGVFLQQWTVWLFWLLWSATVASGIVLLVRRRLPLFPALAAVVGLVLSASSVRNLPLLPILAAPLWGDVLAELKPSAGRRRARFLAPAVGVVSLMVAAWVVSGGFFASLRSERTFGVGLAPHNYPVRIAVYLDKHSGVGRVFNSAADGGFLQLHFPALSMCMDSRYIEAAPVRRYFDALKSPAAFRRLDAELRFDAALLKVVDSGPVLVDLVRDPGWVLTWGDLHRVLLVRRDGPLARRWPRAGIHLEAGDDLAARVHGIAAIQWTALLIESGDRTMLVRALEQLGGAERVPSFVVQYALQYALANNDSEVLELGRQMAPRIVALAPEHRRAVEQLLAAARKR